MNIANKPAILIVVALVVCTAPPAHTESEGEMIPVGKPFADFNLPAHDGSIVRSEDLAGRPFLLFFYPKADTPG